MCDAVNASLGGKAQPEEKPGCTLVLTFGEVVDKSTDFPEKRCHANLWQGFTLRDARPQAADLVAQEVTEWLSARSGLSEDYAAKIMVVKVSPNPPPPPPQSKTSQYHNRNSWDQSYYGFNHSQRCRLYVTVRFNTTANCFEVMQQITERKINDDCVVEDVTCPVGCFRTLMMHPKDSEYVAEREVHALLQPYGEIYSLEHLKKNGIRTGVVRVVMFVLRGAKVTMVECNKDKTLFERIDNEAFGPSGTNGRVSLQFVEKMWKMHGPKS